MMAGFSPISFAGLGVTGVSMASGFPEPKPLFPGIIRVPHLSPLTYAISLSLAHIQTQESAICELCVIKPDCITLSKHKQIFTYATFD